jgi:hypothetical protein
MVLIVDRGPAQIARITMALVESLNGSLRLFYLLPILRIAIPMRWGGSIERQALLAEWRSRAPAAP